MKKYISLLFNILIIIFEIVGFSLSFSSKNYNMFYFYTEDSNIFALIVSILFSLSFIFCFIKKSKIPNIIKILRYMSTNCLCLTFFVVLFVLGPTFGYDKMLFNGSMLYQHLICPVLAVISFCIFEDNKFISRKYNVISVIPTFIYAITMVIINILKIYDGPYPFLRVYNQSIFMSIIWFILIIGGDYLLGMVLRKLIQSKK